MVSLAASPVRVAFLALCAYLLSAAFAHAQGTPQQPPAMEKRLVVDARRSLPMFPTASWKDGFFVEHSDVPDLGLHLKLIAMYGRDPLGTEQVLSDRLSLYPAGVLSINKFVDLGLILPLVVWQDSSGVSVDRSALGDLRLLTKVRIPIPPPFPTIGLSLGMGFPTGSSTARVSADQLTFFPRIILDLLTIKNRLLIAVNLGGIFAGSGKTCNPAEQPIDMNDPMKMRRLPCPCDPMAQPLIDQNNPMKGRVPCPMGAPTADEQLAHFATGLGNHLFYGIGASISAVPKLGLFITTELVGSFAFASKGTATPVFWNVGLRRAAGNKYTLSAMYGLGLTETSPSHTLLFSFGFNWEHEEKPPDKKPTVQIEMGKIPVEVNVNVQHQNLPAQPVPAPGPQQGHQQQGHQQQGHQQQGHQPAQDPAQSGTDDKKEAAPADSARQKQQGQGQGQGKVTTKKTMEVPGTKEPVEVPVSPDWFPKQEDRKDAR